ncbi:MAG: hypothetical protein QXT01_04745 [Sulfolobales archaeon]
MKGVEWVGLLAMEGFERLRGRVGHIYPIRRRVGHIYQLRKDR